MSDLHDHVSLIPFDKITDFFTKNLRWNLKIDEGTQGCPRSGPVIRKAKNMQNAVFQTGNPR